MNYYRPRCLQLLLLCLVMVAGMLSGCASDSGGSNSESLNIYEIWATKASFTPTVGDQTSRKFQLTLSNQFAEDDDILYFTNRGAQQAGTLTLSNLINTVWPRVYGTVAPNALLQGKTAANETVYISCSIEKPMLSKATGQLGFAITYLSGQRPNADLNLTDLQLIITNNAATAQTEVWSHNLDGTSATLEPAKNADGTVIDGTYTFRVQKAFGNVLGITCAPQRKTESVTTKSYFDGWSTRFDSVPPNVSITYTDSNLIAGGGVFTATLSNPVYDEKTGSVSFTAKNVYSPFGPVGKTTLTMTDPTVFIDAGQGGFPSYDDNIFSIQVRNSTSETITVWLVPNKPPCSEKVANDLKCDNSKSWDSLTDAFTQSKTKFYKITKLPDQSFTSTQITPSSQINLEPKQILRIVPPIGDTGTPEWWYTDGTSGTSTGTGLWVTKSTVTKQVAAPNNGGQIEFNVQGGTKWPNASDQLVNYDISGVNGMHFNSSITFEGAGCGETRNCSCNGGLADPYRVCMTNLADYVVNNDGTNNDGCPYAITRTEDGVKTCPNPKYWPFDKLDDRKRPDWVVAPKEFTVSKLDSYTTFKNETQTAINGWLDYTEKILKQPLPAHYVKDTITGYVLSDAAIGAVNNSAYLKAKRGYHVWWATNPVALNWLKYYQVNSKGNCDAYGWAYDEQKWDPGTPDSFDGNQNPPANQSVTVDISCPSKPVSGAKKGGKYLNIDIFHIM